MSASSTSDTKPPRDAASFLQRVIAASANWSAEQRQQFRDFFCTDETDLQLIARLGISAAQLRERRQGIAKLVQVTA
ncbi:hypothetical protein CE206_29480 (plasmid) [Achromobacter xylosoxidans]|uniref:hypothetical protein n=1 Tax=Alcaligenes xylosoxydans xylosoxydans TaxID=85698 RepID=UPI000DD12A77|nr:hypothetical protein [Achromobacter xylosoxidans]AXA80699.1 hypothetical protein CE206_29480 [Achromobacter xylosoxidans]